MIRTAIVGAVVALVFSVTAALSFQQDPTLEIAVDLNPEGNSGTAVGAIDTCRSMNVGESIDIDIVVKGIPPRAADGTDFGMVGFGLNLHFDPAVVHTTNAVNNIKITTGSSFEFVAANYTPGGNPNPFPGTTGNSRVDNIDLSGSFQSGDGVLIRFTIEAVGAGRSTLTVDSELEVLPYPAVFRGDADITTYDVSSLQNALITVGEECAGAPPSTNPDEPTEQASATPTPEPTSTPCPTGETCASPTLPPSSTVPIGNAELAVDVVTTGNQAAEVGTIEDCASATNGQAFFVDVVVEGVEDLLAWELPVSYNPDVLKVTGRDVKLFQAANSGSEVFDASNQTPNETGTYIAAAFDSADPASPDSGDGVLLRLTMTAVGDGTSPVSIDPVDIDGDGGPDRGILLRNADNAIIGDNTDDTFFDGPHAVAEIRVGSACPGGEEVVSAGPQTGTSETDDGNDSWVLVAVGAAAVAVLAAAAAGLLLIRRRRTISQ